MNFKSKLFSILVTLTAIFIPFSASAQWVTGLNGASGSTIGPDGALYVTEGGIGQITRIDPWNGDKTTFASGLPLALIGVGGAVDVAFIDGVAYALVSLVDVPFGGDANGIYRIDSQDSYTVIADIGAFSAENDPLTPYDFATGVQYAMEPFRGGLLVTDGHHNRVLWVKLNGQISNFNLFENIVPTGLEVHGNQVYMAQAGPAPHNEEDGIVWSFGPKALTPVEVASGARLLVDVEFGLGRSLYALSQGEWDGAFPGSPAIPNDGSLLEINADGTFTVLVSGINLPTSMEFIGNTAYVVSLTGNIYKYENVSSPPFGKKRIK